MNAPLLPKSTEPRLLRIATIVGAVLGAALPFVAGGASVPFFPDIEGRIGFGVLAAAVYALFGAVLGWAFGSVLLWSRGGSHRPRD